MVDSNADKFYELWQLRPSVLGWKILLSLAYDGPESMYGIMLRIMSVYPWVHRVTSDLERTGWIEVVKKQLSEKGVTKKVYGLTVEGLLWIFSKLPKTIPLTPNDLQSQDNVPFKQDEDENDICRFDDINDQRDVYLHMLYRFRVDKIAKANADLLPLVFGEWNSLKKAEVTSILSSGFADAAFSTLIEHYYGYENPKKRFKTLEGIFAYKTYKSLLESLCQSSIATTPILYKVNANKIRAVCKLNPQIRELVQIAVFELKNEWKQNLNLLKQVNLDYLRFKPS
jgi:hypothetical protein